jgi:hypothetical protein
MDKTFRQVLWMNFAGTIDMLSGIISLCPQEVWEKDKKIFFMAYHTSIFLDYYLSYPVKNFTPVLPYTLTASDQMPEDAIDDVIPDRHYSKAELVAWLTDVRVKCKNLILDSSDEQLKGKWINAGEIDLHGLCPSIVVNYSVLEIIFYNFRHVQHHIGQLNYLLRLKAGVAADWVAQAE